MDTSATSFVNTASAIGYYTPQPGQPPVSLTEQSTAVVDAIKLEITKTADRAFAQIGDPITYKILFTNRSSVPMTGVAIVDNISPWTTLVADSIRPVPAAGETLATGIGMGEVPVGASVALTFRVTVNANIGGTIENSAFASATFADSTGVSHTIATERVVALTNWITAGLSLQKTASKNFVMETGEEVAFTLVLTNTSSGEVTDIVLTDPLPAGMVYVENSTLKNGQLPYTNENPENGILVGNLAEGQTYTLQFTVKAYF